MSHYRVGCDAHKYYSLFTVLDDRGNLQEEQRVNHRPGAIRDYLSAFPEGTPVALESVGNWYCLHWAAGTRGLSTRSKPQGVCPKWPTLSSPKT
jgi:hypothetical protein